MGFVSDIFGGDEPDNSAQVRAANDSIALQQRMYDEGVERMQPFLEAGYSGLDELVALLGLGGSATTGATGSLTTPFSLDLFQESPSYQYNLDQSETALERALASQGKFTSMNPEAAQELMENASNLASNEYQQAYNNYNTDQSNLYNRIANLAGLGPSTAQSINAASTDYADTLSDLYADIGNLSVAQNEAEADWNRSMWTDIGTGLAMFSDSRLKENIKKVGERNGFNLYEFNYKWSPKRWIGVIAQEVAKKRPDAVTTKNGYLAVYYDKLGFDMEPAHAN